MGAEYNPLKPGVADLSTMEGLMAAAPAGGLQQAALSRGAALGDTILAGLNDLLGAPGQLQPAAALLRAAVLASAVARLAAVVVRENSDDNPALVEASLEMLVAGVREHLQ